MFDSRICLSDVYGTKGLATRDAAVKIAQQVKMLDGQTIEIDFNGTSYASIAFLDQLQHELRKSGKKVIYANVGDFVQQLLNVIERRKDSA
jgi:hypothetical protein